MKHIDIHRFVPGESLSRGLIGLGSIAAGLVVSVGAGFALENIAGDTDQPTDDTEISYTELLSD